MSDQGARVPRRRLPALAVYTQPRVLSMLFLGFSSGLPFLLVYQTLSAWLRQTGIERATIGMLAWVGIVYAIKVLWAPVVDRLQLPLLDRMLGRRRAWMLLAQAGLIVALFNLSRSDPGLDIRAVALWALMVAICGATQDIAIDAWRIESAPVAISGAMAAAYQIGFRAALVVAGAGAFVLADHYGWHVSYQVMAALVVIGVITTLLIREPVVAESRTAQAREQRVVDWLESRAHWPESLQHLGAWFIGAVVCPLVDFFARYRAGAAIAILAFMSVYRLTEFGMGSMANSFYIDHGYTLTQIAAVVKVYGLAASIIGIVLGGVLIAKFGLLRSLVCGSILMVLSNTGYSLLAHTTTPTLLGLGLANGLDSFAQGIHGTVLIAFLSSLTSPRYTATQYALFTSLYALPGKVLEGTSGFVVDAIGYPHFFLYTASLSIPGLLLLWWLMRDRTLWTPSPAT